MQGILLRVGIDQAFGGWNAPVDPDTREFVYVPIPEDLWRFRPGLEVTYDTFKPAVERFIGERVVDRSIDLPASLVGRGCHLDPDFQHLTYGDQPHGRGRKVSRLDEGDFIAFFASLKPVRAAPETLLYALIGIFFVKNVLRVCDVPQRNRHFNAHTRRKAANPDDVVIIADPGRSGRFRACLPIGSYRNRAYRVRKDLLARWNGLDIKDGFIQRSVNPPSFLDPKAFLAWLDAQEPGELMHRNN